MTFYDLGVRNYGDSNASKKCPLCPLIVLGPRVTGALVVKGRGERDPRPKVKE